MSESQPIELDAGTPEIDLINVKKRSIAGVIALTSRTFLVQIISFVATFFLTVFLSPNDYGTFFLVSAVVNFFTYFSDIGLAAALIQKKEKLTRSDLTTTFTVQQLLVITLIVLLFILTPYIRTQYELSSAAVYLMWSLALSLFFSSLKTIPSILLERELQFNKLVLPQILENLAFNLSAVYLAWQGWGINTFTFAVLLRGLVGLVAMYLVSPWTPGFSLNRSSLKNLLHFGLPYQANTFLAVIKDDGMTIFLGKIIGQTGLGYIGWASRWAYMPLRFFMDNITKVAFPAYSRVQHDQALLKRGIEKTIFYLALVSFPAFVGMGVLAHPLILLIPRYEKWLPALIPLYLYLINAAWATVSTPLTNALNAIGKIRITFKFMVMWTMLTWVIMPFMAIRYGYLGVSISAALIATSSIIVMVIVYKLIKVNFFTALSSPTLASVIMGISLYSITSYLDQLHYVFASIIVGGLIYFTVLFLLEGKTLFTQIRNLFIPVKS